MSRNDEAKPREDAAATDGEAAREGGADRPNPPPTKRMTWLRGGSRWVVAAGGEQGTVLGLPGLGDLLASINQHDRPEVALGKAIASGKTLDEAKALSPHRIEALELLPVLRRWVDERKVRAPILPSIVDAVWGQRSREELLTELMTAPLVGE